MDNAIRPKTYNNLFWLGFGSKYFGFIRGAYRVEHNDNLYYPPKNTLHNCLIYAQSGDKNERAHESLLNTLKT